MNSSEDELDDVSASFRQLVGATNLADSNDSFLKQEEELMNQLQTSCPTVYKKLVKSKSSKKLGKSKSLNDSNRKLESEKRLSKAKSLDNSNKAPRKLESEKVYESKVDVSLEEIKAARARKASRIKLAKEDSKKKIDSKKKRAKSLKEQTSASKLTESESMENMEFKSERLKSPKKKTLAGKLPEVESTEKKMGSQSERVKSPRRKTLAGKLPEVRSMEKKMGSQSDPAKSPRRQSSSTSLLKEESSKVRDSKSERVKSQRRKPSSTKLLKEESSKKRESKNTRVRPTTRRQASLPELESMPQEKMGSKSERARNPRRHSSSSKLDKNESRERRDPTKNSSTRNRRTLGTSTHNDRSRRESRSVSPKRNTATSKSLSNSCPRMSDPAGKEPDKDGHSLKPQSEHQPKKKEDSLRQQKTVHTTTPASEIIERRHTLRTKRRSDLSPLREEEVSDPSDSLKDQKERGHRGDRRTDELAPSRHRARPLGDASSRRCRTDGDSPGQDLMASPRHNRRGRRRADLSSSRHSICGRPNALGEDSSLVSQRRLSSRCLLEKQKQRMASGRDKHRSLSLSPENSKPSRQSTIPAVHLEQLGRSLDDSLLDFSDDEEKWQQRPATGRPSLGNRSASSRSISLRGGKKSPRHYSMNSRQTIKRQSIIAAAQLGQLGLAMDDSSTLGMSDSEEEAEPPTTQSHHAPSFPYRNKRMSMIGRTGPRMTAASLREKLQRTSSELDLSSNRECEEKKADEFGYGAAKVIDASFNGEAEMKKTSKRVEEGSSNNPGGLEASSNGALATSDSFNDSWATEASWDSADDKKISATPDSGRNWTARNSIVDVCADANRRSLNGSSSSLNFDTSSQSSGSMTRQRSNRSLNGSGGMKRTSRRKRDSTLAIDDIANGKSLPWLAR